MHTHPWPEDRMREELRGQAGRGTFEAHVTVEAPDLPGRERFRALCERLGVKSVLIELPRGQTPSQPMTSSYHRGELAEVVEEVAGLAGVLRGEGFPVTRVKLEAVVTNEGVPRTDEESRRLPLSNYFEFHVKVTLPAEADLEPLRALCARHDAHLSRNAFRQGEGRQERFATLRLYGMGGDRAGGRFEALREELTTAGYVLSNSLREYSLFDSNLALDAGWLPGPEED
jgi:hypothetical protein